MTAPTSADARARLWHREPWFWFVWALPATAVVASLVTALLAIRGADRSVEDDSYNRGLAIGVDIARQRAAVELGLRADLYWPDPADAAAVVVVVRSAHSAPTPLHLSLRMIDPAHHRPDRVASLLRTALAYDQHGATYRGHWDSSAAQARQELRPRARGENRPVLPAPVWDVTLETDAWRIDGSYTEQVEGASAATDAAQAHAIVPAQAP